MIILGLKDHTCSRIIQNYVDGLKLLKAREAKGYGDKRGQADEHLSLGRGTIDLRGIGEEIQRMKKRHPIILCMRRKEDIVESIRFLEGVSKSKGLGRILGKRGFLHTEVSSQ